MFKEFGLIEDYDYLNFILALLLTYSFPDYIFDTLDYFLSNEKEIKSKLIKERSFKLETLLNHNILNINQKINEKIKNNDIKSEYLNYNYKLLKNILNFQENFEKKTNLYDTLDSFKFNYLNCFIYPYNKLSQNNNISLKKISHTIIKMKLRSTFYYAIFFYQRGNLEKNIQEKLFGKYKEEKNQFNTAIKEISNNLSDAKKLLVYLFNICNLPLLSTGKVYLAKDYTNYKILKKNLNLDKKGLEKLEVNNKFKNLIDFILFPLNDKPDSSDEFDQNLNYINQEYHSCIVFLYTIL